MKATEDQNAHYFHCATKGLENDTLFGSEKAFIAGMNRIGFCYLKAREHSPLFIIAFCLMDNHVHFVLHGTEENCWRFMETYKRLTEIWLSKHPDEGLQGKTWDIGVWQIKDKEGLMEKIVYVLRNPMAAGLPFCPTSYRWSSGSLMFSDNSFLLKTSTMAGSMSDYQKRNLFKTRVAVPDDWMITQDEMIWPGNYTEYQMVERLSKGVSPFMFELNRKVEGAVNAEILDEYISLPDSEIRERALVLVKQLYRKERIADLTVLQRQRIGKELKKRTGTSTKQIARIVRVRYEVLKELI